MAAITVLALKNLPNPAGEVIGLHVRCTPKCEASDTFLLLGFGQDSTNRGQVVGMTFEGLEGGRHEICPHRVGFVEPTGFRTGNDMAMTGR